jgi:hypothetical protein
MKALLGCAVLGLALLAGTACGGPAPTCQDAGGKLLDTIAAGAKLDGLGIASGQVLESADAKGTYVVAAKASVAGGAARVGVWTTSNLDGEGAVYAVDDVAKEVTSFGDSAQVESGVTAGDEAVGKVKACL